MTGLYLNDTVLQCRVADGEGNAATLLISTENGRILYEGAQALTMQSGGDSYFLSFPPGAAVRAGGGGIPYGADPGGAERRGFLPGDLRRRGDGKRCVGYGDQAGLL